MDVWHENQALTAHAFDSRHRAVRLKAVEPSNPDWMDTLSFSEYLQ